jgi:hypothetical protein
VAYLDLVRELAQTVPNLPTNLSETFVQRAWADICQRRTWSFLIKEGGFNAPPIVQGGTVTITQNSVSVVVDATAGAAINAVAAATPPLIQRQFRVSTTGTIYNIVSWNNGTLTLVLDRPILETSAAGASYMIYQCYFSGPPESLRTDGVRDFNRWISVMDPVNGWTLKDDVGKAWLDVRDPQRATTDLAFRYVDYKADTYGNMLWEFWPHPTSGQQYVCLYKAKGLDYAPGNRPLPSVLPESLILDRALSKYCYRWLQLNPGQATTARMNWLATKQVDTAQWRIDLQAAINEDENLHLEAIVGPLRKRYGPPVDASFLQAHSSGLEPWA